MSCRYPSVQHSISTSSRLRRGLAIGSASLLATMLGVPGTAGAETTGSETGLEFTGIVIGTFQAVPRKKIAGEPVKGEPSGALDLSLTVPAAGGAFEIEVKGGTTPRNHGVSEVLPEANGARSGRALTVVVMAVSLPGSCSTGMRSVRVLSPSGSSTPQAGWTSTM